MLRTVEVRLYPTTIQVASFVECLNITRRVYNHGLEHRIKAWKRRKESVNYNQQTAMLTKWRHNDSRVEAVSFTFCREALKRLNCAFQAFFRRVQAGEKPGHPRFKGRNRWHSFEVLQTNNYIRDGKIRVPKLGLVKCRNLRPIDGIQKCLRIIRRADRWFAQILIDDGRMSPEKREIVTAVGLDVGLKSFIMGSDGVSIPAPRHYRRLEKKLKRANQLVSRKIKGSHNRRKAIGKLQRVHLKISDTRSDFTHKLSSSIVDENDLVVVEKLHIAGMVHGRLAKSILDAAWGQFTNKLRYKAEKAGTHFIEVDPRGTTQDCSQCGETVPKDLSVRVHDCPYCGLVLDRDWNAARNILHRGLIYITSVGGELRLWRLPWGGRGSRKS